MPSKRERGTHRRRRKSRKEEGLFRAFRVFYSRLPRSLFSLAVCAVFVLTDPVAAAPAETARLVFQTAPLMTTGDVAAQVQRGLKTFRLPAVHVRFFVVGADRLEAARKAAHEFFSRNGKQMPAMSVVSVGGLPRAGAQVLIEAVLQADGSVNPSGLAFVSGQPAGSETPVTAVAPLIEKSLAALQAAHRAINAAPGDVLRATCFVTSLQDSVEVERMMKAAYPRAAVAVIQHQRQAARSMVECETVARLREAPGESLRFVNPEGLTASPNYSHIALIGAKRLVFSGQQLSPGMDDAAARGVFETLSRVLQTAGASIRDVAMSSLYPTSQAGSDLIRKTRFDFYDRARPPASTLLLFDGLPPGAAFALDVIAVLPDRVRSSPIERR